MKQVLILLVAGAFMVGVVVVSNRPDEQPLRPFRVDRTKVDRDPVARREAVAALQQELQVLARAESGFVVDWGRPTNRLPKAYGYMRRRGSVGPFIRIQDNGWSAMLTDSRTAMTCTLFAVLDRGTGRYIPGQPNCFSELPEDTIAIAAAPAPAAPLPEPPPAPDTFPSAPQPRPHRDWGPVNNKPPRMPYVVEDACEGEGCATKGLWAACSTLVAFKDARRAAPQVFTIPSGDRFTALTSDIHVEAPGMLAFRDTVTNPGDEGGEQVDSIRFVPADTLYILYYIGEGYLVWWYRGQASTGYQFWDDSHGYVHGPKSVVVLQEQRATSWVQVRNAAGKEGWIVRDGRKMATGGYMDEVERCTHPTKE